MIALPSMSPDEAILIQLSLWQQEIDGQPTYPAQVETISPLVVAETEVMRKEITLLEESFARDASREKIYSEKLGRWIYAKPK